jgi:L-lactate dehydrogenase complex protein LldG
MIRKALTADTSARQSVLDRIRSRRVEAPELPEIDADRLLTFEDPLAHFSEVLATVGGEVHEVETAAEVAPILKTIEVFASAERVVSLVPDAVEGSIDPFIVDDPHHFATLDWTIAPGRFMVAENGSIWVDGNDLPHRVLLFIAQYLAIVVPRGEIVCNMHQAYERIENLDARFGIFVSGPSKTADIEQSLVLGAHGCRKLQVFVVGDA